MLQVGIDDYLESVFTLQSNGSVAFYATDSGKPLETVALAPPSEGLTVADVERSGPRQFNILWSDGSLTMEEIRFLPHFDAEGRRSFERGVERLFVLEPPAGSLPQHFVARSVDRGPPGAGQSAD
ncbi:MAG: hypothetical protein R2864_04555 [Syntrophotaleaceae bacterium]